MKYRVALLSIFLVAFSVNADERTVSKFEDIVSKFRDGIDSLEKKNGYKLYLSKLEYDIKKTDSLITPIIGIIKYQCLAKSNDFNLIPSNICRATYSYKKKKWLKKSNLCNFLDTPPFWIEVPPNEVAHLRCQDKLP